MASKKKVNRKKTAVKKVAKKSVAKKGVKKAVKKKVTSVKATAKKAVKKVAKNKAQSENFVRKVVKVTKPYTKSEFLAALVERTNLAKKDVGNVLAAMEDIIQGHMQKGAAEKFILPGILKMNVKQVPAKKARKGTNPFTGEPTIFKAKPASRKVKVMPLKNLKEFCL